MDNTKSNLELELGKYSEEDLMSLTDENVEGGGTILVFLGAAAAYVSQNTCPTSACTRAC